MSLRLCHTVNVMQRKKILVVDDEIKVCELLRIYGEKNGYEVITATDGSSALEQVRQHSPDLILLDLNLPGIDGLEVCRIVRSQSRVPIIMLTARDEERDKIGGLETGADDYVTKPFSPREVIARIRALLRRLEEKATVQEKSIEAAGFYLDITRHEISYLGFELSLTPAEFKLLTVLMRNPGRVYTRLELVEAAFGDLYEGLERTIDAHIKNIRKKLEEVAQKQPVPLITVRGFGYKLEKITREKSGT
jgi:two-component system, OmpR family, alkaline phosphatase synthesis response regulator PhoP